MKLQQIYLDLTICKVKDTINLDLSKEFVFLSKTDEEISLVCGSDCMPSGVIASEAGWRALRVSGLLDFGLTGILSKISGMLAEAGIPIFVISTYNTDYILMKSANFDEGVRTLMKNGYDVE